MQYINLRYHPYIRGILELIATWSYMEKIEIVDRKIAGNIESLGWASERAIDSGRCSKYFLFSLYNHPIFGNLIQSIYEQPPLFSVLSMDKSKLVIPIYKHVPLIKPLQNDKIYLTTWKKMLLLHLLRKAYNVPFLSKKLFQKIAFGSHAERGLQNLVEQEFLEVYIRRGGKQIKQAILFILNSYERPPTDMPDDVSEFLSSCSREL